MLLFIFMLFCFLVERMQNGMIQFLASKDVDISKAVIGFHVPPFISQNHLHLHGISPVSEMSFSDRISFMIPSFWFKSVSKKYIYCLLNNIYVQ